jgi:regulator of replication initiation timing
VAGALPNLSEDKEELKAMVGPLLRERDHLEIENLRLQVELDRYKKHYCRPRADQVQSADDLTQLLINHMLYARWEACFCGLVILAS